MDFSLSGKINTKIMKPDITMPRESRAGRIGTPPPMYLPENNDSLYFAREPLSGAINRIEALADQQFFVMSRNDNRNLHRRKITRHRELEIEGQTLGRH